MKLKYMGIGALVLVGIALLIGLAFVLELGGLQWKRFFAPKHEDVRRDVFKRTRSYNEAKEQELLKYRLEYIRAKDPVEKEAIASTVRMAFSDYDESLLDSEELRRFLKEIKYK
jgi:hypothetical protein